MKRIDGLEVTSYTEFGVEYELDGETFVTVAEDEDDARLMRAGLRGRLVVREIFVADWASLAPDE